MAKLILFVTVIALFSTFPALSENGVLKIVPEYKELLLKVGATQDLNCSVTTSDSDGNTQLLWTLPTVDGKQATTGVNQWMQTFQSGDTFTVQRRLQIISFDTVNAGEYKCSLANNNSTAAKVILLTAVKENKTEPVYMPGNTSATLSCSINFGSNTSISKVTWLKAEYKNNDRKFEPVTNLKDSKRFTETDNNSLIISDLKREDAGLYIARFEIPDQPYNYDCEVHFQAGPLVQDFDKAKNLIEGDKMDLQCIVKGHPHSEVTWYKDNEILNISGDGRHVVQYETFTEFQTVRLVVKTVEFSDAGDYSCQAYSALFNETSKKTLTVRVKDKLAALWPFLGIVGEVVVLCTIIFIYEKRRNKQVQLEEKAAEEVDGSATDKKEGLRHRGTNNPTA